MKKPIEISSTMLVAALAAVAATAYASLASYDALMHVDAPNLKLNEAILGSR